MVNKELEKLLKNKPITIEFVDETTLKLKSGKNILLEAKFNFYGIIKNNMFIWGSSIPLVNKKFIENIKELRSKSVIIENRFKTNKDEKLNYFYYSLMTQEVLLLEHIKDPINLINNLLLEFSNDIYILNPVNSNNNIQFIGLKKITKRYF
jgi:hypothetical protein